MATQPCTPVSTHGPRPGTRSSSNYRASEWESVLWLRNDGEVLASRVYCSNLDCGAVFDVFTQDRESGHPPCQFCGSHVEEHGVLGTADAVPEQAPDAAYVEIIVVAGPTRS